MISKTTHGGKRPNAGKPKGIKHPKTLEKQAVIRETQQRVYRNIDPLLNAQLANALGSQMVFRRDTVKDSKGNEKPVHTLVTDASEIKEILDSTDGKGGRAGEDFYIITTVQPDNRAIDSLLDRGLGKAVQSIEVSANNAYFERDVFRTATVIVIRQWESNEEYIARAARAMVKEHGYVFEEFHSRVIEALDDYSSMKKRNDLLPQKQIRTGGNQKDE